MKNRYLKEKRDEVNGSISGKTVRAVDLVTQSAGASSWLTVLPIRVMNFYLNKSKSRDGCETQVRLGSSCRIRLMFVFTLMRITLWYANGRICHTTPVNWRIWRRNCLTWCVKTLKSNQFSFVRHHRKRADQIGEPTPPRIPGGYSHIWAI